MYGSPLSAYSQPLPNHTSLISVLKRCSFASCSLSTALPSMLTTAVVTCSPSSSNQPGMGCELSSNFRSSSGSLSFVLVWLRTPSPPTQSSISSAPFHALLPRPRFCASYDTPVWCTSITLQLKSRINPLHASIIVLASSALFSSPCKNRCKVSTTISAGLTPAACMALVTLV